jgi:dienelactone hydrolase
MAEMIRLKSGGAAMDALYAAPTARPTSISCPVIGFFGDTDFLIPVENVRWMEAELRRHAVPTEFHRDADAGHAFCNFTSTRDYCPGPAADSRARTVAFLDKHLRAPARRSVSPQP